VSLAAALVEMLRARGVTLEPRGDKLRVVPASAVTPEEVDALRRHKAEVLALLMPEPPLALDPQTVREVLGRDADDPHAVACLRFDVLATVRRLEQEIASGRITPRVRLIRGQPLALWLGMEQLARLMGAWDAWMRGRG
jgi:hypothetical protein